MLSCDYAQAAPDERFLSELTASMHEETSSVTDVVIPGGWAEQLIRLGEHSFRMVLPADPDAFVDQLEEPNSADDEEPDLFWARLWPCATLMAETVLNQDWTAGREALEIGCGVGLVGLAALARGLDVTFADHVPLAVAAAVENARRNGYSDVRGRHLDWHDPPDSRFPVILGSDVLYDRKNHLSLLALLERMLTRNGVCWIGDPGRYHAPAFVHQAIERGFSVHLQDAHGQAMSSPETGDFQLIVIQRTTP